MTQPTPEQLAFHEEVKSILDKHQTVIGEMAMVAILAQVAGSVIAIPMVYDGLSTREAADTIVHNARLGIQTGLDMIEAANKGDN